MLRMGVCSSSTLACLCGCLEHLATSVPSLQQLHHAVVVVSLPVCTLHPHQALELGTSGRFWCCSERAAVPSTRQKNPSLCSDFKALKGRPAKDSPGGGSGCCGSLLLPLEIGAVGCFCVFPVSKTWWELQGAGSELPGRDLGWEEKGSLLFPLGRVQPHRAASALPSALAQQFPRVVCSQEAPNAAPGAFLMHKPLSTTPTAAPGLSLPTGAHPSSSAGHYP